MSRKNIVTREEAGERAVRTLIERHRTEFAHLLHAEQKRAGLPQPTWHPLLDKEFLKGVDINE